LEIIGSKAANSSIQIRYYIAEANNIIVAVYNAQGDIIEELVSTRRTPGTYALSWQPRYALSGSYYVLLKIGNATFVKQIKLIK
jgi:hypothetical protein